MGQKRQNFFKNKLGAGHLFRTMAMQCLRLLDSGPSQGRPPNCGAGLLQALFLSEKPPPHGLLQSPYRLHAPQLP